MTMLLPDGDASCPGAHGHSTGQDGMPRSAQDYLRTPTL